VTSVSVRGLHKAFGSLPVLRGVDLEVPDGSLTAVLGPSGSGKTTLLRILAGFERADAGTVALGGEVVADSRTHVAPEHRRIGYVPQDGALFPHLSAAGNVGFGLPRRERRGRRVEELLELVGLAGAGQRYPHELSGGQQQRVALARALARAPGLVLLDEPFSSLDAALRAEVREDVARVLRETGTTAVLVTHDQDEALSLSDEVAVLRGGVVAQHGRPEVLYARPLDPEMAGFVGDANLLPATVRGGGARTALGTLLLADRGGLVEGQEVLVLVRPEQVDLHGTGGGVGMGEGEGVGATVVDSRYYGHDMVVTVETLGRSPRLVLRARLTGHPPLPLGRRVTVSARGPVTAWPSSPVGAALRR
jgi:iron(III) transport system ATP-binding protein